MCPRHPPGDGIERLRRAGHPERSLRWTRAANGSLSRRILAPADRALIDDVGLITDLDDAIDFYSRMFGVEPAKSRPGYANFAIAEPPLKLVLFEGQGEGGTINHLGVETETADEVVAAEARLTAAELETTGVDDTECCYAQKTETWLAGPDDTRWEWYVKTGDSEQLSNLVVTSTGGGTCCSS